MSTISQGIVHWLCNAGSSLEDLADRLNHVWTTGLLLFLAATIALKQGTSKPIACNTHPDVTSNMAEYIETACWNAHAIYYPSDIDMDNNGHQTYTSWWQGNKHIPTPFVFDGHSVNGQSSIQREKQNIFAKVTLYQWLPIILCFQAMLFKLPSVIFNAAHAYSGLNFERINGLTLGVNKLHSADRKTLSRQVARYLYNWCSVFDNLPSWRWLTIIWCLVKCLYCINIVIQLVTLDQFLQTQSQVSNHSIYGETIIGNMLSNNVTLLRFAHKFPREVRCVIEGRHGLQGYISSYNQCFLPINSVNESVFMLMWVWFVFVAMVTSVSLLVWLLRTLLPCSRRRYIYDQIFLEESLDVCTLQNDHVDELVSTVGEDGVLVLKLIGVNSSDHVVKDIVWNMWLMKQTEINGRTSRIGHS